MKNLILIVAALFSFSTISLSQEVKDNKQKSGLSKAEKKELKADKKALNLTKEQKAELKKIKAEKKAMNIKSLPKKDRKAIKKRFKKRKMALLTPEQRVKQKAIDKKKKEFKNN